mmetsp:Transcript_13143/g.30720  ORF Transcript_13143/g.30720 Transcript_13143/m.30720 type:complete len:158 (+) Transcript_13143:98-571(+)|eukprot:CAMPEP_0178459598 /NCGR_PEP_ID=MMETSP0689_2-20121128/48218_1 /TAXON_ID=160604 /ORGANISM="Amphidinium massartii, Strain CS-259" /LENGTH=157 /DNA_ID=CAMNT_0020086091 /DNA_START=60 /DNA_END=533 /DNA_ORIENTATION=-
MFRNKAPQKELLEPDTRFASEVGSMIRRKLTKTSAGMPGSLLPAEKKQRGGRPSSYYYLDDVLGLTPREGAARPDTSEALYVKTSYEGGGRKDYLRRRSRRPVQERYASPITENMTYGFYPPREGQGRSVQDSPRKTSMKEVFFRRQGVPIRMDGIM